MKCITKYQSVAVLEFDSKPDPNKGPDPCTLLKFQDPSSSKILTNPLIALPLSASPNCA